MTHKGWRVVKPQHNQSKNVQRMDARLILVFAVYTQYENMPISDIQKISPSKTENFQIKTMIFFMFVLKTKIVGTL